MDLIRSHLSDLRPGAATFIKYAARASLGAPFGMSAKKIEALTYVAELTEPPARVEYTEFGEVRARFWCKDSVWMIDYRLDHVEFTLPLIELCRLHIRQAAASSSGMLEISAAEAVANDQRVFVDDTYNCANVRIYGFDSRQLQPLWDALCSWQTLETMINSV